MNSRKIVCIFFLFFNINLNAQDTMVYYLEDFKVFFDDSIGLNDVLNLKNVLPDTCKDGFYHYYAVKKENYKNSANYRHIYGKFINGKKDGEFVCEQKKYDEKVKSYNVSWQQVVTYKNGLKDGFLKEYSVGYTYFPVKKRKYRIIEIHCFIYKYIEYSNGILNGFYLDLGKDAQINLIDTSELVIYYYENGVKTKTMKNNGFGLESIYKR